MKDSLSSDRDRAKNATARTAAQDRPLALRGLPQADQETRGRQMLVLTRAEDDQVSRLATLHECQIACGASGSIRPGEHPGAPQQPSLGRRLLRFLELSGVGRLVGDEDVEETRAARLDWWIA